MPNLDELLGKYLQRSLTEAEGKQLSLLAEITPVEVLEEELEKAWVDWKGTEMISEERSQAILQAILKKPGVISDTSQPDRLHGVSRSDRHHGVSGTGPRVIRLWKWVAAACIVLVTGYGLWVTSERKATRQQGNEATAIHDVPAPKETRAVITLADGSKVYLDSANNGTIAQQSSVNVIKTADGKIVYSPDHQITGSPITYNTLSNPRGSKVIDMTLSDGSHVWLNAGSSVTYPVAFIGKERKVEITGEAYFEVAHDASKPFIVSKGETSITVLGTHFNVNAYDDEDALRVTLLEGSVKVSNGSPDRQITKSQILKPGQQAVVKSVSPDHIITTSPDIDEVMAWKNGRFQFGEKVDVETIMRQIARWYDVDVEYKGDVTQHFGGSISREVNISQVLKVMEATGGVKFKVEGKKVTVMP
jgi:ferric-dicitrate binding protein FerR (iron transport regulator)